MTRARTQHELDLELVNSIDVESGLTDWEANFVDSLLKRLNGDSTTVLTDKQRDTAERILRRLDERAGGRA